MKDALAKALAPMAGEDTSVDRILAVSFFRTSPMQAGTSAQVIRLDDHCARARARGTGVRS